MIIVHVSKDNLKQRFEALHSFMFSDLIMAGRHFQDAAKRTVGVSAGGAGRRAKKIRNDPSHKEYEDYRHSKPGEPPRKITGWFQQHIILEIHDNKDAGKAYVAVGVQRSAWYGAYLDGSVLPDLKPRKVAPRPWVMPTYAREQTTLQRIMMGGHD